jgi:dienelactone hydrolase
MPPIAPYGFWASPIDTAAVIQAAITPAYPRATAAAAFWLEARPAEQGRQVIVAQLPDGTKRELLPPGMSAKTRLLEYGGCPYWLCGAWLVWVEAQSQQLFASALEPLLQGEPCAPLQLSLGEGLRFGDLVWDARRQRVIAVMEDTRTQPEPQLSLVALPLPAPPQAPQQSTEHKQSPEHRAAPPEILLQGADFYAWPCLSATADQLVFIAWDHPNMPWDSTALYCAALTPKGAALSPQCLIPAGGQALCQPQFGPDGQLYWISDHTQWWNLYRSPLQPWQPQALHPQAADWAAPRWVSGDSHYGFVAEDQLLGLYSSQGRWQAALVALQDGTRQDLTSPWDTLSQLHCQPGQALLIGANSRSGPQVCQWHEAALQSLTPSAEHPLASAFSAPQDLHLQAEDGQALHGFYYPPHNPQHQAPKGTKPPLLVLCHGGPTGATSSALNVKIQYWTSRGFAVLDLNYRGSSGYGRRFRQSLTECWGLADLDDLCRAAEHLTRLGWVHPEQRFIKGSSAGGFSALAALCFHTTFNAAVSLYGIGDLALLAEHTHKFEAHYLDQLIGPYPASAERYAARSPLQQAQGICKPVLLFQGLQDKVVPPEQAQALVAQLRAQGTPVRYVEFADEGHGFRQAHNLHQQLTHEEAFYQALLQGELL